jgi:hypothetical protein
VNDCAPCVIDVSDMGCVRRDIVIRTVNILITSAIRRYC